MSVSVRPRAVGVGALAAVLGLLAACDSATDMTEPLSVEPLFSVIGADVCSNTTLEPGSFKLIKKGGSGSFHVLVRDISNTTIDERSVHMDAGDCAVVHFNDGAAVHHVIVTETSATPESIECYAIFSGGQTNCRQVKTSAVADLVNEKHGALVIFHNTPPPPPPPPPPPGNEGCTPGYWKNHLDAWAPTGFSPSDDFDTTFGVDLFTPDITLEEALNLGGGGKKRLARHGTAALLSAAHAGVAYPLSVAEAIATVQAGDADALEAANELGCPL